MSPLPLSKELFPIGFYQQAGENRLHPKPVCLNLLEKMRMADVTEAYVVLRKGKWDIPAYLGDGKSLNMNIGYLIMDLPYGVPFTLDQAFPFIQDTTVVFGFPDTIFQPDDAFLRLLVKQAECNADVVLGLFPAENPHKMDMVALNESGNVSCIQIKPTQTSLKYTWIIAVWNYAFTCYLHKFVNRHRQALSLEKNDRSQRYANEIYISDVVQSALNSGYKIENVVFNDGDYIDIGTPEDMVRATKVHLDQHRLD